MVTTNDTTKMRLLIGYNGTDFARAAIEDLKRAGVPQQADALVLTVAGLKRGPQPKHFVRRHQWTLDLFKAGVNVVKDRRQS